MIQIWTIFPTTKRAPPRIRVVPAATMITELRFQPSLKLFGLPCADPTVSTADALTLDHCR